MADTEEENGAGSPFQLFEANGAERVLFQPESIDLVAFSKCQTLTVQVPDQHKLRFCDLILDIYDYHCAQHPDGHFGWYSAEFEPGTSVRFRLEKRADDLQVSCSGGVRDRWVNPASPKIADTSVLLLHLVLRNHANNAVISLQSLVAYCSQDELIHAEADRAALFSPEAELSRDLMKRGFNMPSGAVIHVVTGTIPSPERVADRPTAVVISRQLALSGVSVRLYATSFDPRLRGRVTATAELQDRLTRNDILVVLYDDFEPNIAWLTRLGCRKAFVHLGLPSNDRIAAFDAELHRNYLKAREDLGLAAEFDFLLAGNKKARNELEAALMQRRSEVVTSAVESDRMPGTPQDIPVKQITLFGRDKIWEPIGEADANVGDGQFLLCAARLEPDSNLTATLSVFEKLFSILPDIRLVLASQRHQPLYANYIRFLQNSRYSAISDNVQLLTDVPDVFLKKLYQQCCGVIHLGVDIPAGYEDALLFGKPIFITGAVARQVFDFAAGTFRLYGTEPEQADAIRTVLASDPAACRGGAGTALSDESTRPAILSVVEQLLQKPVPTVGIVGAGQSAS